MNEQLPSDTHLSMECKMVGCHRPAAEKLIQALRAENAALKDECAHYRRELRDLSARAQTALTVKKS